MGYISYANCGLPYYIGGVIEDPEDLTLQTPESFWKRFRVRMKVRHEVTVIHAGLKGPQLKDLDLAYAPPYSSAKDPVNMAGFIIDNIAGGLKQWHLADDAKLPRDGSVTLLDTRPPGEYSRGHIGGFQNIPVDELRERIGEIKAGKPVYVICQSGVRSYIATRILEGYGFEAYNFAGGFRFYDAVMNDRALVERATGCGMDKCVKTTGCC